MIKDKPKITTDKIPAPSKKWVNWWKANCDFVSNPALKLIKKDTLYKGSVIYPSKELSEEGALKFINKSIKNYKQCTWDYLGASPDE